MVTLEQVQNGVIAFYEHEMAQKANGLGQFAAYFFMPSVPSLIQEKINKLRESPLASGLMSPDGLIDLDAVRDRAAAAMQHCGNIDIMGFRLYNNDINALYDYIRRA